jgi:hypothetical protein
VRNNRRAIFSVVSAALVATQQCCKHISAAVNEHAKIEEAVFSVGVAPMLYNEDLRQLELELRSGVGICSREISEGGRWRIIDNK